jgi:succinate dehydrogenase / fumarate reductase membrane anchor subunit
MGSTLFYIQRFSAVFLLGYLMWVMTFFIFNQPFEFTSWQIFTNQIEFLILTTLVAFISILHAFIGLWTVGTDYFTPRTLGFLSPVLAKYANLIRGMYTLLFCLIGLSIILIILFTIWS